jgi:hypothetical protein
MTGIYVSNGRASSRYGIRHPAKFRSSSAIQPATQNARQSVHKNQVSHLAKLASEAYISEVVRFDGQSECLHIRQVGVRAAFLFRNTLCSSPPVFLELTDFVTHRIRYTTGVISVLIAHALLTRVASYNPGDHFPFRAAMHSHLSLS